jgi:CBS domain-containing protein
MNLVSNILKIKGGAVWSVTPKQTAYEALELMAAKNVGAVVVMDGGRLVGMFSERDYSRKVVLMGRSSRTSLISELMTTKIYYVKPEATAEECMQLMTEHHIRHLPVLEGDQLVGMVSIGDVVKSLLMDREFRIQQLENYISGPTYPVKQD